MKWVHHQKNTIGHCKEKTAAASFAACYMYMNKWSIKWEDSGDGLSFQFWKVFFLEIIPYLGRYFLRSTGKYQRFLSHIWTELNLLSLKSLTWIHNSIVPWRGPTLHTSLWSNSASLFELTHSVGVCCLDKNCPRALLYFIKLRKHACCSRKGYYYKDWLYEWVNDFPKFDKGNAIGVHWPTDSEC